ncbi:MAG: tRNA preQ1(34) S-adenosylmethionine ribosyltransferase-isomerase QueA [Planctomycetota bacterium]
MIELYDYDLPPALIAQHPAARRDASRALFLTRHNDALDEGHFADLQQRLSGDECFVVNNTRVIPARIRARRASSGAVEVFLLRREEAGVWQAWISPSRRIRPGETLTTVTSQIPIEVLDRHESFWTVSLPSDGIVQEVGEVPLPPYIQRAPDDPQFAADRERYQTLFATVPGAVAAPTAGLHFSAELLAQLEARGIPIVPVTLHVGPGTFQPVTAARIEDHVVAPELYEVSLESHQQLQQARSDGRRLIAVGTTSARVLESLSFAGPAARIHGETGLTILPGHEFRNVDGLVTNFHLPRSSLLVLVAAFHGRERTLSAYEHAVRTGMRFYSYGDAMVILPEPR